MTAANRISSPRRGARRAPLARTLAALALVLTAGAGVPLARAQDQALVDRVNRLQQELSTLQRHVYGGGGSSGDTGAPLVDEGGRPLVARLELRMSQLEDEVRRLTGRVEEVSFQMNKVSQRLDTLVADVDQRLQRLEQGAPGAPVAGAEQPLGMQPGAASQLGQQAAPTQPAQPAPSGQAGTTFDGGPKVLGSVSANDLEALRQQQAGQQSGQQMTQGAGGTGAGAAATPAQQPATQQPATQQPAGQQTAALVGGTPKEQYDHAFALLSQANYPAAEQALLAFLERYPDDTLAGNAKYWLGETYYVRGQFREAAVTFAEGFQRYPGSPKAPDNLLKLGKSLAALGQTGDACGTFTELKKRYPDAPATIHQQATAEQQRLGCQ